MPSPQVGGGRGLATPYLARATVLTLPRTVIDIWGTEG